MKSQFTNMKRFAFAIAILTVGVTAEAAPNGQNQKFAKKLYADLLNRAPNRTESDKLAALLDTGATRTQVVGAITAGSEYRTDQIQQYFGSFLNRPATAGEVSFLLNYVQNGATDDDVKAAVLGGDEYYRFAGGNNIGFLNKLFQDVLGRPVDPASALTLQALLGQGMPRQTLALLVLHSLEADQREVTQFCQKFLNRLPSTAELANYSQMLQLGTTDEFVIDLMCGSDEYFQSK
jgi:hypothetical protein